jgi:hypothetical protein
MARLLLQQLKARRNPGRRQTVRYDQVLNEGPADGDKPRMVVCQHGSISTLHWRCRDEAATSWL